MRTFLLLFLAATLAFGQAAAQGPKSKHIKGAGRAFHHQKGASRSKANKAQFRRNSHPAVINLHPHDPRLFTKVKAGKPYKYPQPKGIKK